MKKYLLPLLLLLAACHSDRELPPATSSAMRLYEQYADHKDLTVSLIGGYQKGGHEYNAVMLQAQSEEAWERLMEEYCPDMRLLDTFLPGVDSLLRQSQSGGKFSSRAACYFTVDTVPAGSDISEAEARMAALADSLSGVFGGNGTGMVRRVVYQDDQMVDSMVRNVAVPPAVGEALVNKRLVDAARSDGQCGYIVHVESSYHAVWIFFYADPAEGEYIATHVAASR